MTIEAGRVRASLPVRRSVREGYRLTWGGFGSSLLVALLVQGAVAIVAAPILVALFHLTLSAAGLPAVTDRTLPTLFTSPLAVLLLAVAAAATVLALLVQTAVFVRFCADRMVVASPRASSIGRRLGAVVRRLVRRPSTLLLLPYLLLLVPLGYATTGSLLTRWVAIPSFVTDELLKEPATAALYLSAMVVLFYLNLRMLFTLPILVLTEAGVPDALAASWRFTRWRTLKVLVLLLAVTVPGVAGLTVLGTVMVGPTMLSDAVAPDASAIVAAVSLGVFGVVAFVVAGLVLLTQTQTLVAALVRSEVVVVEAPHDSDVPPHPRTRRVSVAVAATGAVLAAGVLSVQAVPVMTRAADGSTIVLAHRGWTEKGVENTLPALEGAASIESDAVEMDIQQTADRGWVLMHDTSLKRLAGLDTSVARLTQDEATQITVRADGHSALIPSLADYLDDAVRRDQQLLIEIKTHGGETPDYLEDLLALLDAHGGADQHIYHSLDPRAVAGLKQLRPTLMVGFIVPLAFGGVPETPADFLVLEQSAYSEQVQTQIHNAGKSVFVWTVQDAAQMRMYFRLGVDGIITDHPDVAMAQRTDVADDTGMTQRLADALDRLITLND